ncbi:MAG: amidohydrolase family protein [Fibrobacteria bacterium]|nr:amidohydrolase family protein [Fibrobacteria bacterium]
MIYKADYVITMAGPPIKDGAVKIRGNRISEVRSISQMTIDNDEEVKVFKDTIIMPGLINAHCHLELGYARGLFPPGEAFSMWLARVEKSRKEQLDEDYENAIRLGIMESIHSGTTTLFDVGKTGLNIKIFPDETVRSFPVREFSGGETNLNYQQFDEQIAYISEGSSSFLFPDKCQPSVSIRSPYTCSETFFRHVLTRQNNLRVPFSFHLSEGQEEEGLYKTNSGQLHDFCERNFGTPPDFQGKNPVNYLLERKLIPQKTLLVHCNVLDVKSASRLAEKNVSIAHCPRSSDFFEHPEFPFELCYNNNINVCLGTESMACNEDLSLFEEMHMFRSKYPHVDCSEVLKLATVNGARALGMEDSLGKLLPGYLADFIGITIKHDPAFDMFDEIVCEEHEVAMAMIDGEEVLI